MPYKAYYQAHKGECKGYNKLYYETHKEHVRVYCRNYHQKIKRLILGHYSNGSMKCIRCGFDDIRALSIDHINGGGTKHREVTTKAGIAFYLWLKKNNYPKGYQVLCMNCQWIKRATNGENRKSA